MASRGQALVEFALVAPVLTMLLLGGLEAGLVLCDYAAQGRATGALADWAAVDPDRLAGPDYGPAVLAVGLDGCTVTTDLDTDLGLLTVGATCAHANIALHVLWETLDMTTTATAALPAAEDPPAD